MRFCCTTFEYWSSMAGARGFGIFTARFPGDEVAFIIQHRALDNDVDPPITTTRLSLVSELRIHICPWCGVVLKDFYGTSANEMQRSDLKIDV